LQRLPGAYPIFGSVAVGRETAIVGWASSRAGRVVRGRPSRGVSLRTELRDTVEAAVGVLEFRPVLDTSGPVDSAVPDDIVPEILTVVREALANVARHAKAHTVRVPVRAADGQLAAIVQDDGVDVDPALARGGLVNLLDRARDLSGTFEVRAAEGTGTVLDWRVPLNG